MDINTACYCKKRFSLIELKMALIQPCGHFIHEQCILKFKKCPFCKINITKIIEHDKIPLLKNKQVNINLKSLRPNFTGLNMNYSNVCYATLTLCALLNNIITLKSDNDIEMIMHKVINILKIKIKINDYTKKNKFLFDDKIKWKNINDEKKDKIIISNHTHDFDSVIIYYLFRCGFVASEVIKDTKIGNLVAEKCNLLLIKRGEKMGFVQKIKEYLKQNNKICIYPEGLYAYNDTVIKFRTGAFYSSDTICPITIKYITPMYDGDLMSSLLKMLSSNEDKIIHVNINDFEYGPFDNEKIEKIRRGMAKQLNYDLSQVSNKFIVDT